MMQKPRLKTLTAEQAKLRMAELCSRSEQCEADILDKLSRHGVSKADSERIVAFLYDNNFLDDARYLSAFVRDKVKFNGWGKRKIRLALAMKHFPSSEVNTVLSAIPPEEYMERAMKVGTMKTAGLDLDNYADRVKAFRYMASRGFESEIITAVLHRLRKDAADNR